MQKLFIAVPGNIVYLAEFVFLIICLRVNLLVLAERVIPINLSSAVLSSHMTWLSHITFSEPVSLAIK